MSMTEHPRDGVSQSSEDERAIHATVSGYYEAFVSDPDAAASYYGEPAFVVLPNEVLSLPTRREVRAFLERGRSNLRALGYLNTHMTASRLHLLNESTALYGTVAIRMRVDGTELERAAYMYLLHKGAAGWKIHELVAVDVEKLIG